MRLLFFQNCISPHQMPYIEALCEFEEVAEVCVIVPRATYEHRATLGWPESWTQSSGKLQIYLNPSNDEVCNLFAKVLSEGNASGGKVVAFFSGISAFPEVKQWFKISLNYRELLRGIITEAPFAKGRKWLQGLHRIHFLLTDYRYINRVHYVFAIGQGCVEYYKGWSKQWKVIPFLYCTQRHRDTQKTEAIELDDNRLRLLYVGSLEPRKNVGYLLEALKGADFDYSLTIVGDGELLRDLQEQARGWGINADFIGARPNDMIPQIMSGHDLLVLPSVHDGWGAVVNEAASVGTLTACSDQCGAQTIANHVFKIDNPNNLRKILQAVSADLVTLRHHRIDRVKWAEREISPKAVARKMLNEICVR